MPTVLDTHAWVWWVTDDSRLSRAARRAIERDAARHAVSVSRISIWEVAKKIEKGQMELDRPLEQWIDAATTRSGLSVADLSASILIESCRLPRPFHGDPADQIIVATARSDDSVIVTKDQRIREYPFVRSIW